MSSARSISSAEFVVVATIEDGRSIESPIGAPIPVPRLESCDISHVRADDNVVTTLAVICVECRLSRLTRVDRPGSSDNVKADELPVVPVGPDNALDLVDPVWSLCTVEPDAWLRFIDKLSRLDPPTDPYSWFTELFGACSPYPIDPTIESSRGLGSIALASMEANSSGLIEEHVRPLCLSDSAS